ncbi:uncharacterized protein DEA37_0014786 [Paragonimus westermani]|uniref:Uncharacterized protein n=1 Tax=Paragonimus westermani TaxID=34504 RepID=A0A5J4NZW8_9TREM|nr:uncharacterized protein DEA37_0014786 [Paragonimus westermani]
MQMNLSDSVDHLMTDETKKRPARNVRIPQRILPKWYGVRLQVHLHSGHPKHFFYNGSVNIKVYCQESTDVIFVHAYMQLNVSLDKITNTISFTTFLTFTDILPPVNCNRQTPDVSFPVGMNLFLKPNLRQVHAFHLYVLCR